MTGKDTRGDSRLNAVRYQIDRLTPPADESGTAESGTAEPSTAEPSAVAQESDTRDAPTAEQRAQLAEMAIQQAIRRGDFDNLPGAGKPLQNLHRIHDPDWWIRQKIAREQLTGLGPPALTLRTENAGLDDRLDSAPSERAVREILDDFNSRVIEARRQLLGGPPVITPTRDVDEELQRWRDRRTARLRSAEEANEREAATIAAMSWRERRRARRAR